MHIAEVVTIAKSLPLLRLNTYKSLILSYSVDYRRILMKNLIAITCFVVALVSCNKVEHKLEGKWQLKTVEANGVVQTVDTVWYNFQTSLFEYQLYDPAKDVYRTNFGYKTLEGDTKLDLELVNYGGTPLEQFMRYTDWTSPKQTFTIEQSSVTNLVMSCEGRTYTFKKF